MHFKSNDEMYISTYKDSCIKKGDIAIIYVRDSIAKSGFVCAVQIESNQIDNSFNQLKIFSDRNLNKYCYQIQTCILFPNKIKLTDVIKYIDCEIYYKKILTIKYDSQFYQIDSPLANNTVKTFFEIIQNSSNNDIETTTTTTNHQKWQRFCVRKFFGQYTNINCFMFQML